MDDLLKKLQLMGVDFGKVKSIRQIDQSKLPIDEVIDGRWEKSRQYRIFISEKRIKRPYIHGKENVTLGFDNDRCLDVLGIEKKSWSDTSKITFIDTETSSLNSGAGSFVFLVGICSVETDHISVQQIFLDDLISEPFFLTYLDERLKGFDAAVSYNGKSFDFPMLKSRFVLNKLPFGLDTLQHIDLLHTARRIWKMRLESHRLADIENHILGFNRSGEDVPGWLVPQIYFDYLDTGNASALEGVFYHNEMDIVSLTALFGKVLELTDDSNHFNSEESMDLLAIGDIFSRRKNLADAEKFFKRGLGSKPVGELPPKLIRSYGMVLKRQCKWEKAVTMWKIAAQLSDEFSCIELAKYYEHQIRDYDSALEWVEKARQILITNPEKNRSTYDLEKRKSRLLKKRGRDER